ncbi:MAG: Ldh family oxidoreductase, partial [candidate division NC10 bacterium]
MASYPGSETEARLPYGVLHAACQDIFAACGMCGADAALLAETLVVADFRGVHSHGVLRVPDYVGKLLDDGVNPRGRPEIVSETGGAL